MQIKDSTGRLESHGADVTHLEYSAWVPKPRDIC